MLRTEVDECGVLRRHDAQILGSRHRPCSGAPLASLPIWGPHAPSHRKAPACFLPFSRPALSGLLLGGLSLPGPRPCPPVGTAQSSLPGPAGPEASGGPRGSGGAEGTSVSPAASMSTPGPCSRNAFDEAGTRPQRLSLSPGARCPRPRRTHQPGSNEAARTKAVPGPDAAHGLWPADPCFQELKDSR